MVLGLWLGRSFKGSAKAGLFILGVGRLSDPELRVLNEMSGKVGRLEASSEATADALKDLTSGVHRLVEKLDRSDDIAREALQSVKSAHLRIDEMKTGMRWMIGTTLSAVGLFLTAIGLLWKAVG